MALATVYPNEDWQRCPPEQVGLKAAPLAGLEAWLTSQASDRLYRVLVVRHGRMVIEHLQGLAPTERLGIASAAKSLYSSMLGIAIVEGRLPSADARVVDYYPEMMDVPEGYGPKAGRYAFEKDRAITFRQLISNTSGYMKPGEAPGQVFHYQTYGMNILMHALGKIYGVYDSQNPGTQPTVAPLIDRMLKEPIGGSWTYRYNNFEHPSGARTGIFGYYTTPEVSAHDMARLGLLWLSMGRWDGVQVVPRDWMKEATQVAPMIREHCPGEQWRYGYGFWTNTHHQMWPGLPSDAFAAVGAGQHLVWACPSLDLVVVQSPGIYGRDVTDPLCRHILDTVVNAVEE